MAAVQTLKGFRDFLPSEALARQWLTKEITKIFELWGYDPMETPALEPLELFKGQVGEDEKLFYSFEDNGGRKVALRYDQTVPAARVVGQHFQELPTPFKRYQIQPAFRAEKPQKGRYREFLQCDADIFGIESSLADAEVIALSLDIYKRLGFKEAQVLINDRALLKDIPYQAIVAIDKLKKIGKKGVITEMQDKGIDKSTAQNYINEIENLKPNENVQTILDYLESYGFEKSWFAFDPTIVRSFSYSTGPIWEVAIPGFEAGSVLGGERFDKLIENVSGNKIPGTGFGLGFDRTLEALDQFGLLPSFITNTKVLVTVFDKSLLPKSIQSLKTLRDANVNAELYPGTEIKLDKQLKYADKKQIPFVLILGPQEDSSSLILLKDMSKKSEERLQLNEAVSKIKSQTESK